MGNKENRFKVVYKDGGQLSEDGVRQILVDTQTGVNYLAWKSGYAGGITTSAIDGIKIAESIIEKYSNQYIKNKEE